MKKMKAYLTGLVLSVLVLVVLVACGSDKTSSSNTNTQKDSQVVSSTETEAITETQTETETQIVTGTADGVESPDNVPSGSDSDEVYGQWVGTVLVVGKTGYETVGYSETYAASYAQIVNDIANGLSGYSTVYCIPVPKSSGICYDDAYESVVHKTNQGTSIDNVLAKMGSNVVSVDVYDTLRAHRDEYLYFRTDHHWTQLGAYYTYTEFCNAKGISSHNLSEYNQLVFEGFVGSLYRYSNNYAPFNRYPDTVYAYEPICNATMTIQSGGSSYSHPIISDVTNSSAGNKYGCFIGGDSAMCVMTNNDLSDGSSCILVKESYGNAFAPFLIDHYQTVYVIDARYWSGNLITFAQENGVDDVIILNNLSAVFTGARQDELKSIVY